MAKIESPRRSRSMCSQCEGLRSASSEGKASRGVKREPIDCGERQHHGEGGKLEHQELPIAGHNQSAERADQDPGVDDPRQDQRRNADNAKR